MKLKTLKFAFVFYGQAQELPIISLIAKLSHVLALFGKQDRMMQKCKE